MVNIKRISKNYRLYLVKPKEKKDAHALAERIASIKSVDEVMLTEGEYGYLVKVKDDDPGIRKLLGNADKLECHCAYKTV
jgi:hypothetical protein